MRTPGWLVLLVGWVAIAACGEPAPGPSYARPPLMMPMPFPAKRVVDELARTKAKPLPERKVASMPARWRVEPAPASAAIDASFPGVTFTKELRCAAREYGRVQADLGADVPEERLEQFIAGACGLPSSNNGVRAFKMTMAETAPDAAVVDAFGKEPKIATVLQGKPAGAWITRKGDRAVLTLVSGSAGPPVTATLADASGKVVVEGTATSELLTAKINRGRHGTADCERDPAVKSPSYRFACTLAAGDPWAWIEVMTQRREESLVSSEAMLIARRDLTTAIELGSTEPEGSGGSLESVLFDRVNRARQAAQVSAVTLAEKQSTTNKNTAPHFFRALADANYDAREEIARGLIAGWDVTGGLIRYGELFGALLSNAKTPESWLDYVLETPLGRAVLLSPNAHQIAIGVAPTTTVGGLGIVVTTYDLFGRQDPAANAGAVYARIAKLRAARGVPAATSLPGMPFLDTQVANIRPRWSNPQDVLSIVLDKETRRLQRTLDGHLFVAHDLGRVRVPTSLLEPGPIALRAAVTTYQPANFPWGLYLVYIITSPPEP